MLSKKRFTPNLFIGTSPQLVAVFFGTIGVVSDGMHYGWCAPFTPILEREDSPIKVTYRDITWLETLYMIGGIAGIPVTIFCVDKFGRKPALLLSAFINLIAWIVIGFANNVVYLYIARFAAGLAGDITFVAGPMYIAEISCQKIRGFLAGTIFLMMLIGILLVYVLGPYTPFYISTIVGAAFSLFGLLTFPFMPESPYYLLSKNQYEKAEEHLKRLRNPENVDNELQEITVAIRRQQTESGQFQDLIMIKGNRKAFIIMTVLNGAQHFSSFSVFLMNIHSILKEADSLYVSFQSAGIMFSAIMVIAATITDCVVDKCGRKILLISSCISTGLALVIIAIYFTFKHRGYDLGNISWIPIAAIMVYAGTFKLGLGIIPIVLSAELFPSNIRAKGMTVADLMYVAFGWISLETYRKLITIYYLDLPFYIFAASTILTAVFGWLYIPETKGKSLDEIQFILKGEPIPENIPPASDGEPPTVVQGEKMLCHLSIK